MQLRQLEADGLIDRTVFEGRPARVEYRLTPHGESLLEILHPLKEWGEGYLRRQLVVS